MSAASGEAIRFNGRARRLGDRINTDYIISSSRKRETIEPNALKRYLLETVDPEFAASVDAGDILVAGDAFGCGSAMEVAVTVVLAAGIRVVVASSFARTYYRNAVNNGLFPVECDTAGIDEGHRIEVTITPAAVTVCNRTTDVTIHARPFPPFLLDMLTEGGLVPYLRARGGFESPVE